MKGAKGGKNSGERGEKRKKIIRQRAKPKELRAKKGGDTRQAKQNRPGGIRKRKSNPNIYKVYSTHMLFVTIAKKPNDKTGNQNK